MKKVISCFIIICVLLTSIPCCQAADGTVSFELLPKITYDKKSEMTTTYFKCTYKNLSNTAVTAQVSAAVKNSDGESVQTISDSINIKPNTVLHKDIFPKIEKSGVYTLAGSVTVGGQSFTISEKFVSGAFNDKLGVCTHFGLSRSKTDDLYAVRSGGFGWIRDDCPWVSIETEKGKYNIPDHIIKPINTAVAKGLNVLLILDYGNPLYTVKDPQNPNRDTDKMCMPETEEEIAAYVNYCTYVVETLKGKVDCFEIWNEPNTETYTQRGYTTTAQYAEAYVNLLKAAYPAIKKANPDACVMGGSIAATDNCNGFLREIFDRGAANYMDVLSIHPYIFDQVPLDSKKFTFANIDNVVTNIKSSIGSSKIPPIWITEVGYANANPGVAKSLTEEQQGAYNVRTSLIYGADERIQKIFLYEFINKGNGNKEDLSALTYNYGMLNVSDRSPKPSYNMLSFMNELTDGTVFEQKIADSYDTAGTTNYSIYKYSGNDKDVIALWTNGGAEYNVNIIKDAENFSASVSGQNLGLSLSGTGDKPYITVYDSYGNEISADALTIDYMPRYIVCRRNALAEYTPSCNINVEYNKVYVSGRSARGFCPVALHVVNAKSVGGYIAQTLSDADGGYYFEFELPGDELYTVFINDTSGKQTFSARAANEKITYYKGEKQITDLSEVKAGDYVTAKLEFRKNAPVDGNFIGAVFSDSETLANVVFDAPIKINEDGSGLAEITLQVTSDNDFIRFFVWNNDMEPLIESTGIK